MRILFFTPLAKRNGAEMMLWYLIKFADRAKITPALYSFYNGELLQELPSDVQSYVYKPKQNTRESLRRRILNRLMPKDIIPEEHDSQENFIYKIHNEFMPDLWYINTILCPEAVRLAVKHNIPYVVHFHDLLFLYQNTLYDDMKSMVENSIMQIGCSAAVCQRLSLMGAKNIHKQYECVDISGIIVNELHVNELRNRFNPNSAFVWVMSGSVEYRKGTDFIPSIAARLNQVNQEIIIIWLGPGSSGYSYCVERELESRGIKNVLLLGQKTEDYYDYLALADGLLLTSREDPFPLVMIEAAALGKPIVAFDSGGVSEFVTHSMGLVVSDMTVEAISQAMQRIMSNSQGINQQAIINRAKEFNAKSQTEIWENMLETNLKLN